MKKRLLAVLLASMLFLTGCGAGGEKAPEVTDATESNVLYTNGGPIEFFETPWLNPGTFFYNKVLFDRLIVADENLMTIEGEGQLAETYEVSEDGMSIKFNLREGITWHDGEAITPEDIKWSIEYAQLVPALNPVINSTFSAISEMTIDGNSLTVNFSKLAPDALLAFTQFSPLPQKYFVDVEPAGFQQADFWQSPVGSGPFKVKEVQMNNYTTLEAFPEYWGGAADYTIQLSPSAGDSDENFVANAQAGKMDYGYTRSIDDIKALEGVEGMNIEQVDVRYTRLFFLNKFPNADGDSPLADVKVRQALLYALDMQAILDGVFDGAANPANSLTPNAADKPTDLNNYEYDVEKAKALLAEANWNPDTVLDVVYYYTDQLTVDLMTIIQSYWSQVGVTMEFRLVEGDLASILWSAPTDPVNGPSAVEWDICYAANAALSLHEYYDRYQTGQAINSHTPSDPTLDALIEATNNTLDPTEITEAFHALQRYENENLFVLPLYYQPVFVVTSDKITKGAPAVGNPQWNYNWDIQNWELGK